MATTLAASPYASTIARLIPDLAQYQGADLDVHSPIDGSLLASLKLESREESEAKVAVAQQAFESWRNVPAPVRGELVRLFGEKLRQHKEELARLVTIECGKILEEGRGEVQEMIDVCDFAVGLSRQLYGLTIASERADHVMQENWLPAGPVGVISAFNFPVAVWSWNVALALVCGDSILWKPSEKTPLCALACQFVFENACEAFDRVHPNTVPVGTKNLNQLLLGDRSTAGAVIVEDERIKVVSATGSTAMGRAIAPKIASRFAKMIMELGGNNAIIVTDSADLDIALPSIVFGAVGTAGQRCTSTRRIIVHESRVDNLWERLKSAYASLEPRIGDPLNEGTLIGPLISEQSFEAMQDALERAREDALEVVGGERMCSEIGGCYVRPALARMARQTDVVMHETFAPLLYVLSYKTIEEALELNNAVPQGLSSSIMTTDVREAEYFKRNSDCGISNVNIGTSGAEIGGAFGGEKETGGGRESGSDSWKQYMRRQTSTIYYGRKGPALAQGIKFTI
jgi:aldehyde dehydrogenase (NAD+)